MPILYSKTALNRPPRILCSENANFILKTAMMLLNRPPRILHSENGNSALKKWKFCPEEWTFCTQKMEIFFLNAMEEHFSVNFSVPNQAIPCVSELSCSSRNSALHSAIAESRNPGGTD